MKAKWRKVAMAVTAFVMASTMAIGFTACGGDTSVARRKTIKVESAEEMEAYMAECDKLYGEILGEFKAAYEVAKAEKVDLSRRYALMAVAEAKFLESGVMLPASTQGGTYAISRAVPYSVSSVLWGNDSDRLKGTLLVNGTPIIPADRDAMKAHWNETEETGAEYITWAKSYLTEHGYTLNSTEYKSAYSTDPVTYDVLGTSRASDAEVLVNTYDGLLEYDQKNHLIPALADAVPAEVASTEDDTVSYTFHIRNDAKWVDATGVEVADVKADDFVAGFQHMLDAKAGLEWLVEGVVVGASEYIEGDKDFSKVGVKADATANTVTYTLTESTPHFLTMLGYSLFAPMSRSFYETKGGKFGNDYDKADENYNYGKSATDIAYCGPYRLTSVVNKNEIVFTKNTTYWNLGSVNVDKITWSYNDGSQPTKAYEDMKNGDIAGCGLNTQALALAKKDSVTGGGTWFSKYAYTSATNATTFSAFLNVNRKAYEDILDGKAASKQTFEQAETTKAAMQNQNFRLALTFAIDREKYWAQRVGDELATNALRNSYTPGTFVKLSEDTTIEINGVEKEFKADTFYGEIIQAQLDADDAKIKAWDSETASSDGFDGWYNVENARAKLEKAIVELKVAGYDISKKNPVHIDFPTYSASPTYAGMAQVVKKSIEEALEGKVVVDLISCSVDEWEYCGYQTEYGFQANYEIYDVSGWGPDYGDPSTYLDTFLDKGAGYMAKCIGLY